jgi:hypothetical protein
MSTAGRLFRAAGIYGIVVLLPLYFMENRIGTDFPPDITHAEYFYGFIGVALAFQLVFLVIATDPVRYKPLMLPSMIEKFSYALAVAVLSAQERPPAPPIIIAAGVDALLGFAFLWVFLDNKALE